MSLLLDERMTQMAGELLIGSGPLPVWCQITAEWLRGVDEPTWYGYFVPHDPSFGALPGVYRLNLESETVEILVRRPMRAGQEQCFPFWGLGRPPAACRHARADLAPVFARPSAG